jgi:GAF domain-containing protein
MMTPCLQPRTAPLHGRGRGTASTEDEPIVVDDLRADVDRWPRFAPAAIDHGLPAVLGIPMHVDGTTIGALNVYDRRARTWTQAEITVAQVLADMATAYIFMVDRLHSAERLAQQLQRALDSRIVVEQAKGALARVHDIDVSEAFELLRGYARDSNHKVHDVAAAVVDGTLPAVDRRRRADGRRPD